VTLLLPGSPGVSTTVNWNSAQESIITRTIGDESYDGVKRETCYSYSSIQ
jgi:hypothetical protein